MSASASSAVQLDPALKPEKVETAQTPLFTRVTDHCPVYVDIADRDDD